jgi:hypothetical protein
MFRGARHNPAGLLLKREGAAPGLRDDVLQDAWRSGDFRRMTVGVPSALEMSKRRIFMEGQK